MKKEINKVMEKISQNHLKANQENMQDSQKQLCKFCEKRIIAHGQAQIYVNGSTITLTNVCKVNPDCVKKGLELYKKTHTHIYMTMAGIPKKFICIKTDRDISQYLNKSLYLWGKAGVGKTVLACNIATQLILREEKVKYISSPKFIMELQDAYKKDSESAYDKLTNISQIETLILDDIGAEKLTDFVKQAFYFIINEREQWERKTIITSNYSLDELDTYIDSRISSRIAGMCEIVELKGNDRRIK